MIRYNNNIRSHIKNALLYMLYSKACKSLHLASGALNLAIYSNTFSPEAQKIMYSNIFPKTSWLSTDVLNHNKGYDFNAYIRIFKIHEARIISTAQGTNKFTNYVLVPHSFSFSLTDEQFNNKLQFNKGARQTRQKMDTFAQQLHTALNRATGTKAFIQSKLWLENPLMHPLLETAEYYATEEDAIPFIESGADIFEVDIKFKDQLKGLKLP